MVDDKDLKVELACATASVDDLEDLGYKGFCVR